MKDNREPENRAVQFSAFDALKGYSEMLTELQREKEPYRELCEEETEKIDLALRKLSKGDRVKVRYYLVDCYTNLFGTVREIDFPGQTLKTENAVIPFSAIKKLSAVKREK